MTLTTTPQRGDSKLILWKKILTAYQNLGGTPENNPKAGDTVLRTLQKILNAINGF